VKSPRKSEASALSKLEALDLSILTEEQRHSAIAEVRAQIAEVAADRRAESPVMERKLALLRLWQRLVQLRIADVRDEVPPPDVRPVVERMFAPEPKPEPAPAPPVEEASAPAPAPPPKRKGGAQVTVKLSEEAVIKGKTHAADEVVQVSRKEADGLVEAGKATVVDAAQPTQAPA
jgi:hypothetical protein